MKHPALESIRLNSFRTFSIRRFLLWAVPFFLLPFVLFFEDTGSFFLGGEVRGLQGESFYFILESGAQKQKITLHQDGRFTFPERLLAGQDYRFSVSRTKEAQNGSLHCVAIRTGGVMPPRDNFDLKVECLSFEEAAVVVEYDSVYEIHQRAKPNPENVRMQKSNFNMRRVLKDLEGKVDSFAYDFVLVYTLHEVPGWIHSGTRYSIPAKNIGLPHHLQIARPKKWPRLKSAPHMNNVDFIERTDQGPQRYAGILTAFHEMFHYWGVYFNQSQNCVKNWQPSMSPAYLATCGSHWTWAWADPGMPGIMYSGSTSVRFNAFDLYIMGLMSYEEAAGYTFLVHEYQARQKTHRVSLDDLISLLPDDFREADGIRIPPLDFSVQEINVLVVVAKGKDETLSERHKKLLIELAAFMPHDWSRATWGRSTLKSRVQRN